MVGEKAGDKNILGLPLSTLLLFLVACPARKKIGQLEVRKRRG
jgi:hypothetical protein